MYVHIGFLPLEVERLGWPERWISACLCSISRRHVSPLISACRQIGKKLRSCMLGSRELVEIVVSSEVEAAVYVDMSRQWRPPQ